jgi:hypothetical protein
MVLTKVRVCLNVAIAADVQCAEEERIRLRLTVLDCFVVMSWTSKSVQIRINIYCSQWRYFTATHHLKGKVNREHQFNVQLESIHCTDRLLWSKQFEKSPLWGSDALADNLNEISSNCKHC